MRAADSDKAGRVVVASGPVRCWYCRRFVIDREQAREDYFWSADQRIFEVDEHPCLTEAEQDAAYWRRYADYVTTVEAAKVPTVALLTLDEVMRLVLAALAARHLAPAYTAFTTVTTFTTVRATRAGRTITMPAHTAADPTAARLAELAPVFEHHPDTWTTDAAAAWTTAAASEGLDATVTGGAVDLLAGVAGTVKVDGRTYLLTVAPHPASPSCRVVRARPAATSPSLVELPADVAYGWRAARAIGRAVGATLAHMTGDRHAGEAAHDDPHPYR